MKKVFLEILQMGLVSGYVILIVLLVRRLLRRFPKRYSYILWSVVLFRLVCPVGTESPVSLVPSVLVAGAASDEGLPEGDVGRRAGIREAYRAGLDALTMSVRAEAPADVRAGDGMYAWNGKNEVKGNETGGQEGVPAEGSTGNPEANPYIQGGEAEVKRDMGAESVAGSSAGREGAADGTMRADVQEGALRLEMDGEAERSQKPASRGDTRQKLLSAACAVWITGIAVFWFVWVRSMRRFRKKLVGAVRVEEGVYESDRINASFVDGVLHPVIYLAPGLAGAAREYVLCHERVHVRRKDPLIKAAALFLVSIYWFHPLVWLAFRRMCEDMEMSCDERVVELLGVEIKKEYSCTLLQMAAKSEKIGLIAAFGGNEVKSRVKNILSYRKPRAWLSVVLLLLVAAVGIGLSLNPGKAKETLGDGAEGSSGAPGDAGEPGNEPDGNAGDGDGEEEIGRGDNAGKTEAGSGDNEADSNRGGEDSGDGEGGNNNGTDEAGEGNENKRDENNFQGEIERQLQLILAQRDIWELTEEYEKPYGRYMIADLNMNGRLEIIAASCQGTGIYTVSNVYEVSEAMDTLVHYERILPEEYYSEVDIIVASAPVYYDKTQGLFQYIFDDITKDGVAHYYERRCAWSLQDGQIAEMELASCTQEYADITEYTESAPQTTYVAGEVPGISVANQDEYAAVADVVFAGWQKGNVYFAWVEGVDESIYEDAAEIEEAWYQRLLESYEGFFIAWGSEDSTEEEENPESTRMDFLNEWKKKAGEKGFSVTEAVDWYANLVREGFTVQTGDVLSDICVGDFDGNGVWDCFFAAGKLDAEGGNLYTTIYGCMNGKGLYRRELPEQYVVGLSVVADDINHDGLTELVWMANTGGCGGAGSFAKGLLQYRDGALWEMQMPADNDSYIEGECGYNVLLYTTPQEGQYRAVLAEDGTEVLFQTSGIGVEGYLDELPPDWRKGEEPFGSNCRGYVAVSIIEKEGRKYLLAKEYLSAGSPAAGVGMACFVFDWDEKGEPYVAEFYVEPF